MLSKLAVPLGSLALTVMLLGCTEPQHPAVGGGGVPQPAVGGGGIPRPDQRVQMQSNLKQIGLAYKTAAIGGVARGPDDLGREFAGLLKSVRDDEPLEIVWKVDPSRVQNASTTRLAWEKTGDREKGRYVLMADCTTVQYLPEAEFKKTPAAQPNAR
jgi:hypothetical protein